MSLQRAIRRPSHRQIPSPNSGKVLAKSWRSPGENHSKHSEQPKRMNSKRRCGGLASAYSIRRTRCLQRERSVQNTLPNVVLLGSLPPLTPPPASASPPHPTMRGIVFAMCKVVFAFGLQSRLLGRSWALFGGFNTALGRSWLVFLLNIAPKEQF